MCARGIMGRVTQVTQVTRRRTVDVVMLSCADGPMQGMEMKGRAHAVEAGDDAAQSRGSLSGFTLSSQAAV